MSSLLDEDDTADTSSDIEDEHFHPNIELVENIARLTRIELQPSDFYFGSTLGEGAYARVVHAKSKKTGDEFAVKIMEKIHIKRENKVVYASKSTSRSRVRLISLSVFRLSMY